MSRARSSPAAMLRRAVTSPTFYAILMGFVVGGIVLAVAGYNPFVAYGALFQGVFGSLKYVSNWIIKSTPIIITGVSVAFAFQTGLFNIGAEGQYIVGAIVAAVVGYLVPLPPVIAPIFIMLVAMAAAGVYGGIVGLLKAKFGIHEVITSIMLNWIALYLNNFIVSLPMLKKPNSESTYDILPNAITTLMGNYKTTDEGISRLAGSTWGQVVLKTDINPGFIIAIVVVLAIWFLLYRTSKGYELRAVGMGRDAAELAGMPVARNLLVTMVISGAIAGLAGATQVLGAFPHRISVLAAFENYGFNGLSVALIAGASPIGCLFSGLLFGGLLFGGSEIQLTTGAPSEVINIMIGSIVYFISLAMLFPFIAGKVKALRERRRKGGTPHVG